MLYKVLVLYILVPMSGRLSFVSKLSHCYLIFYFINLSIVSLKIWIGFTLNT